MAEKKKDDGLPILPMLKEALKITWGNPLARTILKELQSGKHKTVTTAGTTFRQIKIPQINRQVLMSVRKPSVINDLKMPEVSVSFSDLQGRYPDKGLSDTGRAALQWALADHASVGPRNRASYDLGPITTGRARLYRRWFQGLRRGSNTQAPVFPYSRDKVGMPFQKGDRAGNIWQSRNAKGQYGPQVVWNPGTAKQALELLAATPAVTRRLATANPYVQGAMLADDVIQATTGKRTLEHSMDQFTKTLEKDPTINLSPLLPF